MSLATMFDKLAGKQAAREKTIQQKWAALVADLAGGKEPSPDTVEDLLAKSGRTIDDLREAVDRLTKRRQARQRLDEGKKVRAERAKVESQLAQLETAYLGELSVIEDRYQKAAAVLKHRLAQLNATAKAAQEAENFLVDSAGSPEVLAAIRALEARHLDARKRQAAAMRLTALAEGEQALAERKKLSPPIPSTPEERTAFAEGLDSQIKGHREAAKLHGADCDRIAAEIRDIEGQLANHQDRLREP
jgi:hypothetical protein